MNRDYRQIEWDESVEAAARELIGLALNEDLGSLGDVTAEALGMQAAQGTAKFVAREAGVVAGLPTARLVLEACGAPYRWESHVEEGASIARGTELATVSGDVRNLLAAERTMLNLLSRLSGVATQTRRYVDAAAGANARIYDTRKTTPGWRLLEKYAVRKGGGTNHRLALYDSILIKDNHLAALRTRTDSSEAAVQEALVSARAYVERLPPERREHLLVEIEVDGFEQLEAALELSPDVILLDNFDDDALRRAAELRGRMARGVELEASGGMTLARIPSAARTGVDRISVGALTHHAVSLDIGLDWVA